MRSAIVIEISNCKSYEEEKAQVLKELRALLLTHPPSHKRAITFIKNAIRFIEQE